MIIPKVRRLSTLERLVGYLLHDCRGASEEEGRYHDKSRYGGHPEEDAIQNHGQGLPLLLHGLIHFPLLHARYNVLQKLPDPVQVCQILDLRIVVLDWGVTRVLWMAALGPWPVLEHLWSDTIRVHNVQLLRGLSGI